MFRIDDPSAAASLPAPEAAGTEGYWTEGNPGSGVPATLERASWFNMVQEELRAVVVAGGLTPSKTSYNQLLNAIKALTSGRLLNIQVLATSGTYTPTVGTKSIVVEGVGGGGAGGGVPGVSAGSAAAGGGGSAGAWGRKRLLSGFSGVAVTIGAGGGAASGNAAGNPGGTTSFGTFLSLPGGGGGGGGAPGSGGISGLTGGSPSASGADIGSFGTVGGVGVVVSAASAFSGFGGAAVFGAGGAPVAAISAGSYTGNPAGSYGAGGGGALNSRPCKIHQTPRNVKVGP
jgi:hypothetical protein